MIKTILIVSIFIIGAQLNIANAAKINQKFSVSQLARYQLENQTHTTAALMTVNEEMKSVVAKKLRFSNMIGALTGSDLTYYKLFVQTNRLSQSSELDSPITYECEMSVSRYQETLLNAFIYDCKDEDGVEAQFLNTKPLYSMGTEWIGLVL